MQGLFYVFFYKKVVKIKKDRLCKDCGQGGLEPRYNSRRKGR
jgi:hypothetical protein